jgi:bifunctional UDP-N-acetylglucosamine pyrophosphorylase/glucosamine-1-phosphate N-acetyltransferase
VFWEKLGHSSERLFEMQDILAIVLAAGQGTRMKSSRPKVCHEILGKSMLERAVGSYVEAGISELVVVASPHQPQTLELCRTLQAKFESKLKLDIALQEEPRGTGHAVQKAVHRIQQESLDKKKAYTVLVSFADTPAILPKSIAEMVQHHKSKNYNVSVAAFKPSDPTGYGRIFTDSNTDEFLEIKEHKDCSSIEKQNDLCNAGVLSVNYPDLLDSIFEIQNNNAGSEYYLTDLPGIVKSKGRKVGIYLGIDHLELMGVNSQEQLAMLTKIYQKRIILNWQAKGVHFLNPDCVYVTDEVKFGDDCVVEPFVFLSGNRTIKSGTRIRAGTVLI